MSSFRLNMIRLLKIEIELRQDHLRIEIKLSLLLPLMRYKEEEYPTDKSVPYQLFRNKFEDTTSVLDNFSHTLFLKAKHVLVL